ncbi:AEC family transporter [Shewanella canadensis]|uniref:AEC family transporter n=1 Tax=Shewanella canadensis TaxID=271096 RepID=A0A3S0RYP7_9GAMM|nr:AEC family transporter [Shewanella canadensis]RTR39480.1 AEC family transporter [Shewanella canadensis]
MTIFSIIFPLLSMVTLGYWATHFQFFTKAQISGISKFAFNLSIPVFLFLNMYQAPLGKSFDIKVLAAFYLPVLIVYLTGFLFSRYLLDRRGGSDASSGVFALGCSYSNTVLVGLPIIIAALGEKMMGSVFAIITFHSAVLFSLTFMLSAKHAGGAFSWRHFTKSMVLNPVVLSITSGLFCNAIALPIPEDLMAALALISQPALACALFVLGANLSVYKIADDWLASIVASIFKLLILPALVYLSAKYLLHLESQLVAVVVLMSASPLGVNAYLIATQLKQQQSTLGSAVVLSTVLSVFSFSFWLWVLL